MNAHRRLDDRIQGCLTGAMIGAELGFARCRQPSAFACRKPSDVFRLAPKPITKWKPERNRADFGPVTPLIDLGVRAYRKAGGRVVPELFGRMFADDAGVAFPAFWWDGLHTVQEILKEGMNPRISGLGTAPNGLICAAMPAVGIYHFAHPEYAYLDGVELASVVQCRVGADWAGLCAAAVAAAFQPDATGATVCDTVLKVAFNNCRSLFYELQTVVNWMARGDEDAQVAKWLQHGGVPASFPNGDWGNPRETNWIAYNPPTSFLPLLRSFAGMPDRFMKLLLAAPTTWFSQTVSAAIGGAIMGALHGTAAFPRDWTAWAKPKARKWFPMAAVVRTRLAREQEIISLTHALTRTGSGTRPLVEEKVEGCILAGAIGNAMGSPVEGMMYQEIDRKYPAAITTILDPARLESEDDNQMAMLLVETYLARDGMPVMARHFGKMWQDKLNRHHFFVFCMGHAYDRICEGWDPRIVGHWSQVTGSTVMCMEPVGIYHMADPEFAAMDGLAISYMYQRGMDALAASMLSATVAEAFKPNATVDSVCEAALAAAPKTPLRTFDRRPFRSCHDYIGRCLDIADKYTDVLKARKELYDRCLLYHMIDPLELWGFALAMFRIAKGDVRQAAIGGTNIGRDSDTISGRAAMLSGILSGAGNVPREWVAMFKPESLERIRRNAKRLAEFVTTRKLSILKLRQSVG